MILKLPNDICSVTNALSSEMFEVDNQCEGYKTVLNRGVLVTGYGSIGRRHAENLFKLGFESIYVLTRTGRKIEDSRFRVMTNFEDLQGIDIYATIVCSPTSMHIEDAMEALNLGSHVLIEKPISDSLIELNRLLNATHYDDKLVRVAYMMRFHPLLQKVKEIVRQRKYGKLIYFSTFWGEYLPDWHPNEDYRTSYAAREDLGGGVALTLSHDVDIVNWIIDSKIESTKSISSFTSNLDVEVATGFDIIYKFHNGVTGHSHLDYFSRLHQRSMMFIFDDATIKFDYYKAELDIFTNGTTIRSALPGFERNDLFMAEMKHFFGETLTQSAASNASAIAESRVVLNSCIKSDWYNDE
jgi:predicted dehydrogenase